MVARIQPNTTSMEQGVMIMSGIRKGLLSAAGWLAFTSFASSADMAPLYKAPPPPPPIFSWTGFYIGGHVGGAWGTAEAAATSVDINRETQPEIAAATLGGLNGFNI